MLAKSAPIALMNFFRCPVCNGDWRTMQETLIADEAHFIDGGIRCGSMLQRDSTCFHGHSIQSLINLDRHSLVDGRLCP
jgi:hypothetical protein